MKAPRFSIMTRADFSDLSLHEKNTYLQTLADQYADQNERERIKLDKDALSRLRRYYSRRVWADLKLDELPPGPLNRTLRSFGETIRTGSITDDVAAALMQQTTPKRVLRAPPENDSQLMFFVPTIYDAPLKDDVNLMDVAPFSLGKKANKGIIKYELKDSLITVEGGAETGLATVFDYDIFLNMVSYLAESVQDYRREEAKGLRPTLPPKTYRPNASHILKFCRRSDGGKSYEDLEAALEIVEMTLSGSVNKRLVSLLQSAGGRACGLSGVDGSTLICRPLDPALGRVGTVAQARPALVEALLAARFLPVLSPISADAAGRHYNVNADDAAAALATGMKADKLVFVSDVPGVLDADKRIVPRLDRASAEALIDLFVNEVAAIENGRD